MLISDKISEAIKEKDMLDLDIEQFWKDDEKAHLDNCFSLEAPQVALGIRMSNECVYAELGVEGHPWDAVDPIRQAELNKRYNDKNRTDDSCFHVSFSFSINFIKRFWSA